MRKREYKYINKEGNSLVLRAIPLKPSPLTPAFELHLNKPIPKPREYKPKKKVTTINVRPV